MQSQRNGYVNKNKAIGQCKNYRLCSYYLLLFFLFYHFLTIITIIIKTKIVDNNYGK